MKMCFRCGVSERTAGAYCRPCATQIQYEWRARNRGRYLSINRKADKKRCSANVAKFTARRRERMQRWKRANPEAYRKQAVSKYRRTRDRALAKLGGKCACCGEARATMLHIDHIHNDGYKEGRGRRSYDLAKRILRLHDPWSTYQVLCANCNHSKARNHGLCEHYTEKWMCWLDNEAPDPGPYRFSVKP